MKNILIAVAVFVVLVVSAGFSLAAPQNRALIGNPPMTENTTLVGLDKPISAPGITNAAPFDFDGDSKTDVSIFRPSNGQWWFLQSSDNTNYTLTFGVATDKLVPADYTGDGKTDVAVFRPSTGEWFILRSEDFTYYAFPLGIDTDTPAPGDYDGDGKADPAVFRDSTGTWYINKSTGGIQINNFGTAGDKPIPADWDGDSITDIAVKRGAQWWIQRSSDGTHFGLAFGSGFVGQDLAAQGDYTNDGKADAAFYNSTRRLWYIMRSQDGQSLVIPFGLNGDVPVPGDYDGDNVFDIAVYRPSDNTWYIQGSTVGYFQTTFGSSGDMPVPYAYVR